MPARNEKNFPSPDQGPDENIVPGVQSEIVDDDALWMLLNAYADGEATSDEVLRVEQLLGSRPGVASEFAFLKLTSDSVRDVAEIDPPISMTDTIFAATTRRKTLAQRVRGWLCEGFTAVGPAPLRWSGGAVAAGALVMVLWSRFAPVPTVHATDLPRLFTSIPQSSPPERGLMPKPSPANCSSGVAGKAIVKAAGLKRDKLPPLDLIGGLVPMFAETPGKSKHTQAAKSSSAPRNDIRPALRLKLETTGVAPQVAAVMSGEQRHMAGDGTGGSVNPDDLGPDVEERIVDPVAVAEMSPPAASHDEPPTTAVTVASYRPGSISDMTRNSPPAVQSLYMRTQEAIRRQHELQQYGGYGKDAFNNIRRGEVGLSLVGSRF